MYEFLAKNVGIRRASGRFIMGHALDTIITEKWWEDVGVNDLLDRVEREASARQATFVIHRMIRADSVVRLTGSEPIDQVEQTLTGRVDQLMSCQGRVHLEMRPLTSEVLDKAMREAEVCVRTRSGLFVEASGDFELMTREAWKRVRGFAERNSYAHFDSVLMYMARKLDFEVHGHFRSVSDPSRYYLIWHQGHAEGGYIARLNSYETIETPFWKYFNEPMWGYEERAEWGMPRHHFEEVVWLNGKLQQPAK